MVLCSQGIRVASSCGGGGGGSRFGMGNVLGASVSACQRGSALVTRFPGLLPPSIGSFIICQTTGMKGTLAQPARVTADG